MAIQYSGLTIRNDVHTGITTYPALLDAITDTLEAAGWTTTELASFNTLQYTGQPLDTETIVLQGSTYTFKAAINNATPNEVLLDSTADLTYSNLVAAITGGAGSGTKYSSATVTSTVFSASVGTNSINISTIATGPTSSGAAILESLTNANWLYHSAGPSSTSQTAFGGYRWKSDTTPAGLSFNVIGWIRFIDATHVPTAATFVLTDASATAINPSAYLRGGDSSLSSAFDDFDDVGANLGVAAAIPSTTWRIIANGYQFFCMANTVYTRSQAREGIFVAAGVPWIPDFSYPKLISAATTATPIVITTTAVHGWTTGDSIAIDGVEGLSGANGSQTVTVLTTTTASLDGSVGTGTYTAGGTAAEINVGLASCAWLMGSAFSDSIPFYTSLTPTNWVAQILNGSVNVPRISDGGGTSYGVGTAALLLPSTTLNTSIGEAISWYNTDTLATEPLLCMGTANGATPYLVGQIWDCFFHSRSEPGGTTGTFDSKNWYVLTNAANGSSTEKEGALALVVP